jgi:hypothetical protein
MSNCLIFALFQWWHYGGYVIVRQSRHGWWPHFMWAQHLGNLEAIEFIPYKPIYLSDNYPIPPIVFRGYVRNINEMNKRKFDHEAIKKEIKKGAGLKAICLKYGCSTSVVKSCQAEMVGEKNKLRK